MEEHAKQNKKKNERTDTPRLSVGSSMQFLFTQQTFVIMHTYKV